MQVKLPTAYSAAERLIGAWIAATQVQLVTPSAAEARQRTLYLRGRLDQGR